MRIIPKRPAQGKANFIYRLGGGLRMGAGKRYGRKNAHGSWNVMGAAPRDFFDLMRAREFFAKICVGPPCPIAALRAAGKLKVCVRRPAD